MEVTWSDDKSELLQAERDITFEDVVAAIEKGAVLDDFKHPDPSRQHQRILVVEIRGYACAVPYISDERTMFLKTVYRNRKMQTIYMRRQ